MQSRRTKAAARKFFRKRLKGFHDVPRVIITDKLASYGAAQRELLPGVEHRQHKRLNHRAENSHQPTRQRGRTRRRFKSAGQAQGFLAAFLILGHSRPRRHRFSASGYRPVRQRCLLVWAEVTSHSAAA